MRSYNNSLSVWEDLNKVFLLGFKDWNFVRKGGCTYLYDLVVSISNPKLDPEFDFGKHFNYSMAKWKSLVSNYVDKEALSEIRDEVLMEESKGKSRVYNLALQFNNKHKHGKNCLLSIIFSRRAGKSIPTVLVYLRSSEVTKRLACDLLLFQRIGEYVYGEKKFDMVIHFNQLFNDDTVLLMYHAHENIFDIFSENKNIADKDQKARFKELSEELQDLLYKDDMEIKYKIYRRVARAIQVGYKKPKTLAKDCTL